MIDEEVDVLCVKVVVEYEKDLVGKEFNIIYFIFYFIDVSDDLCDLWVKVVEFLLNGWVIKMRDWGYENILFFFNFDIFEKFM